MKILKRLFFLARYWVIVLALECLLFMPIMSKVPTPIMDYVIAISSVLPCILFAIVFWKYKWPTGIYIGNEMQYC